MFCPPTVRAKYMKKYGKKRVERYERKMRKRQEKLQKKNRNNNWIPVNLQDFREEDLMRELGNFGDDGDDDELMDIDDNSSYAGGSQSSAASTIFGDARSCAESSTASSVYDDAHSCAESSTVYGDAEQSLWDEEEEQDELVVEEEEEDPYADSSCSSSEDEDEDEEDESSISIRKENKKDLWAAPTESALQEYEKSLEKSKQIQEQGYQLPPILQENKNVMGILVHAFSGMNLFSPDFFAAKNQLSNTPAHTTNKQKNDILRLTPEERAEQQRRATALVAALGGDMFGMVPEPILEQTSTPPPQPQSQPHPVPPSPKANPSPAPQPRTITTTTTTTTTTSFAPFPVHTSKTVRFNQDDDDDDDLRKIKLDSSSDTTHGEMTETEVTEHTAHDYVSIDEQVRVYTAQRANAISASAAASNSNSSSDGGGGYEDTSSAIDLDEYYGGTYEDDDDDDDDENGDNKEEEEGEEDDYEFENAYANTVWTSLEQETTQHQEEKKDEEAEKNKKEKNHRKHQNKQVDKVMRQTSHEIQRVQQQQQQQQQQNSTTTGIAGLAQISSLSRDLFDQEPPAVRTNPTFSPNNNKSQKMHKGGNKGTKQQQQQQQQYDDEDDEIMDLEEDDYDDDSSENSITMDNEKNKSKNEDHVEDVDGLNSDVFLAAESARYAYGPASNNRQQTALWKINEKNGNENEDDDDDEFVDLDDQRSSTTKNMLGADRSVASASKHSVRSSASERRRKKAAAAARLLEEPSDAIPIVNKLVLQDPNAIWEDGQGNNLFLSANIAMNNDRRRIPDFQPRLEPEPEHETEHNDDEAATAVAGEEHHHGVDDAKSVASRASSTVVSKNDSNNNNSSKCFGGIQLISPQFFQGDKGSGLNSSYSSDISSQSKSSVPISSPLASMIHPMNRDLFKDETIKQVSPSPEESKKPKVMIKRQDAHSVSSDVSSLNNDSSICDTSSCSYGPVRNLVSPIYKMDQYRIDGKSPTSNQRSRLSKSFRSSSNQDPNRVLYSLSEGKKSLSKEERERMHKMLPNRPVLTKPIQDKQESITLTESQKARRSSRKPISTLDHTLAVLLIEPMQKLFEVVFLENINRETTVGDVLAKARENATDAALSEQKYNSLCNGQQELAAPMLPVEFLLTEEDYTQRKALLVAVPVGSTAADMQAVKTMLWQNPKTKRWWDQQDPFHPLYKPKKKKKKSSSKERKSSPSAETTTATTTASSNKCTSITKDAETAARILQVALTS